jgi:hypothetical protein
MERKEDKIMALNTYGERRKYERLFPPSEHWIFYKNNGKRRGAYSKKIYKTKKSAEEQWGYDNSDPMYKSRLFKKKSSYASRAWSRGRG